MFVIAIVFPHPKLTAVWKFSQILHFFKFVFGYRDELKFIDCAPVHYHYQRKDYLMLVI